jgi:hypothetical protein
MNSISIGLFIYLFIVLFVGYKVGIFAVLIVLTLIIKALFFSKRMAGGIFRSR